MSEVTNTHSGLMDGIYRYQRHIYDATRKFYLLGRDRLIAELKPPVGGTVLEIGCGTGRNLIAVGKAYKSVQLYGFDISSEMLATAEKSLSRALPNRDIHLVLGDATDFDSQTLFGVASFDRVFISYSLSMIPNWEKALDTAYAALKPNGQLHIVDFGNQDGLPTVFRRILQSWLRLFHVTPRVNLEAALQELASRHGAKLVFRSLFHDYCRMAVISRGENINDW